ncbi:MAG TPA: MFS transporter [Jatrophihabitantaceae bacterium]|jgi:DHA1 family inner membrane transport protein
MLAGLRLGSVRRALLALAAGGFAIGTSEFLMLGLLPQVAGDLAVSIPQAGEIISAYALGVVVGAPLLTAASVRFPRKTVLIVLMSWYAVFNVLTALAPSFVLVLLARFGTGLPHGAFFGVGSVVASSIAPPARRTLAMSVMFAGLTIANVVGVPLSTLLGQGTSWRMVYALIGVVAAVAVVLIALAVPEPPRGPAGSYALRAELQTFRDARIWLVLGVATLGGAGLFATFSYIAPMLTRRAGYADSSVTWLLALFGIGMTLGNLVGARLADAAGTRTLLAMLGAEIVLALVFAATTHSKVVSAVMMVLLPASALGGLPALQGRIIAVAGGAANLAAASIQAAFNVANSIGAYFGGVAISAGFGYASPNVVAAILVLLGLSVALVLVRVERNRAVGAAESERPQLAAV